MGGVMLGDKSTSRHASGRTGNYTAVEKIPAVQS
jgi:hypothetical protein